MCPREPEGADVWHIPLDVDADTDRDWTAVLSAAETATAGRKHRALDARRYRTAHAVTRLVLGAYLGIDPRALRWRVGRNGKPEFTGRLRDWHWNLSHAGGHALLAVSTLAPMGVDLERVRSREPTAAAARFLPADEAAAVAASTDPAREYHRLLARKESCVKAVGGRILDALHLPVRAAEVRPAAGRYAGRRWAVQDLPAPAGYVAALATEGGAVRTDHFTWG